MGKVLARLSEERNARIVLPSLPPGESFRDLAERSFEAALAMSYGIPNRASGSCEGADDSAVQATFEALQPKVIEKSWENLKRKCLAEAGRAEERKFWAAFQEFRDAVIAGTEPRCSFGARESSPVWNRPSCYSLS
jgi:hypothetical protein